MSNGDIAAPFLMVLFLLLAAEKETTKNGAAVMSLRYFLFHDEFSWFAFRQIVLAEKT